MLSPEEIKLCIMAEVVTAEVVSQGHREGYKADGWIKGVDHHIPAAIGHAIDADRMRRGLKPEDAEGIELHLSHALTRIAMALYCVHQEKKRQNEARQVVSLHRDGRTWRIGGLPDGRTIKMEDAINLTGIDALFDKGANDTSAIPADLSGDASRDRACAFSD